MGNITQINDPRFPTTDPRNSSQTYTYDGLYRLTQSSGPQLGACSYRYNVSDHGG